VRGGGPAQHQGRTETVPAPETSRLAGAARVVVCGIHRQQRRRQTFPRTMAAGLPRKPREKERGGLGQCRNLNPNQLRQTITIKNKIMIRTALGLMRILTTKTRSGDR
jgi:hypothetical protein